VKGVTAVVTVEQAASPTGRPRDSRIDHAVLAATTALLAEVGYAGLRLEAVAVRAGTTKPAIRRRWPSQRHLVVDALVSNVGTTPTPDTGCTHCDLIAGIDTLTSAFTNSIAATVLPSLVADLHSDPELRESFFGRFFHPRRASTAAAIERGIARGDLRPDVSVGLLLDLLAATTYYRLLFAHLPVTSQLAEEVVTVVLAGVATPQWREQHESHAPISAATDRDAGSVSPDSR
jgi:AcrR family transcriptional regulator